MEQRLPEATIEIRDYAFQPSEINVKPGEEVTWTNNDSVPHTVTADDGSFDSGQVDPGGSYSHTFKDKGTFKYHCDYHGRMHGEITVG
ncbi:MAG: cupredoxin domain-containing protein [Candidatus Aquicultor sp.]